MPISFALACQEEEAEVKEERNEDQAARWCSGRSVVAARLSSCSPTGLQTAGFTKRVGLHPFTL